MNKKCKGNGSKGSTTKLNRQKGEDPVLAVLWLTLPDESTGAPAALSDAGVILALVGRRDKWHQTCVLALDHSRLPLLTTEAVRTEVFHFARRDVVDSRGVWRLLRAAAIRMAPITSEDLAQIEWQWMTTPTARWILPTRRWFISLPGSVAAQS